MSSDQSTIYDEWEVPKVINAAGTKTSIGGSLIRPEALKAMHEAASAFVSLADLQECASQRISDMTGAEAGYITSGAAAGLVLGAAAAIAGDDRGTMARLPATPGVPDEIILPRTHRTGYDHTFEVAGGTIVDVGTNDAHLGTGARPVEPWEIEDAISDQTAAIGYIQKPYTRPELSTVTDIAHAHDIPVIVDAAAELPPVANLSRFIEEGADLVAFSGGKAIRGPQTTGILAGRADLIESVALQHLDMHANSAIWDPPSDLIDSTHVPRQGLGRSMKVGKEEIVGLLRALELFVDTDHDAQRRHWRNTANDIVDHLANADGIETRLVTDDTAIAPEVVVHISATSLSATEIVQALQSETPKVVVGTDRLHHDELVINPMCLRDGEPSYVIERLLAHATPEPNVTEQHKHSDTT
jgi:D-glucosaminate-6-phosphate ammonia-lyase